MLLLMRLAINGGLPLPSIASAPAVISEVRLTAAAAGGVTSLTVSPLTASLPSGTLMTFGSVQVRTSSWTAAGSTTVPVDATSGAVSQYATAQAVAENVVLVRRVSLTMPAPTLVAGRPTGDWLPT